MFLPDKIIKSYCVTEKATDLSANFNQYTFDVFQHVTRRQVASAIEKMFNVNVTRVNILNKKGKVTRSRTARGKTGKKADIKRAIVSLKKGDKIEII